MVQQPEDRVTCRTGARAHNLAQGASRPPRRGLGVVAGGARESLVCGDHFSTHLFTLSHSNILPQYVLCAAQGGALKYSRALGLGPIKWQVLQHLLMALGSFFPWTAGHTTRGCTPQPHPGVHYLPGPFPSCDPDKLLPFPKPWFPHL